MKRRTIAAFMSVAMVITCFAGCAKSKDITGSVATDGSTSMEKVIGALGESFMEKNSKVSFTYNPTGSGSGITAVAEGTCDIGLSSRNLKDEEISQGLIGTTLCLDGIAVIANLSNGVKDLTLEQIASIYKGEVSDWSELGGEAGEIVVIGREAGSGTRDGFESITDTKDACVLRQELTSTGDVIATVKSNENAIGYASLASVDETVSVLSVEDVYPSSETILNGSYKIQRPFVLVTKKDKALSETAQAFWDYCFSEEAVQYIEGAGAIPVK